MLTRNTYVTLIINGVDCTSSLAPYLIDFELTDTIDNRGDGIVLRFEDRDQKFLQQWTLGKGMSVQPIINMPNWAYPGQLLQRDCGLFDIDVIEFIGPPLECIVKATSIPISGNIKGGRRNNAWEQKTLRDIASDIAKENNMQLQYTATDDQKFARVDQKLQSDIGFLRNLCNRVGKSMKITNNTIVIFDEETLEQGAPFVAFTYGVSPYIGFTLTTTAQGRVNTVISSYTNPSTGERTSAEFTPAEPPEGVGAVDTETDRIDYEPGDEYGL